MTVANILLFMALCMGVVGISMIGASIVLQNSIRKKKHTCTLQVQAVIVDLERSDNISMEGIRTENENEFYCPAEKSGKIQTIFLLLGSLLLVLAIAALAVYKMMKG